MKRGRVLLATLIVLLQLTFLSAAVCNLQPILLNQDPYPAIPGESVKVVFQINGMTNTVCKDVKVTIKEDFPFSLAGGYSSTIYATSGTYFKDFNSFLLAPYNLKVDPDAADGTNNIDLEIDSSGSGKITYSFDIEVSDSRTDFEIFVKEYNPDTRILTFQILNTGENDVEALTVDIPNQENIAVKGSARNIVGSLDSNDDTTFSFEGIPKDGNIDLILVYTDGINERRTLEKIVSFNSDLFEGRGVKEGRSIWFYITIILVLVWLFMGYRKRKNKKRHMEGR